MKIKLLYDSATGKIIQRCFDESKFDLLTPSENENTVIVDLDGAPQEFSNYDFLESHIGSDFIFDHVSEKSKDDLIVSILNSVKELEGSKV